MKRVILNIFWSFNTIALVFHLLNYYFNSSNENTFASLTRISYNTFIPILNLILAIVAFRYVFFANKIAFKIEKNFKYMFAFLVISISTSKSKIIIDQDFLVYLISISIFMIAICLMPSTNNSD